MVHGYWFLRFNAMTDVLELLGNYQINSWYSDRCVGHRHNGVFIGLLKSTISFVLIWSVYVTFSLHFREMTNVVELLGYLSD